MNKVGSCFISKINLVIRLIVKMKLK